MTDHPVQTSTTVPAAAATPPTEQAKVVYEIHRAETVIRESFDDPVQRRAFCLQQAIAALQLRFSDDRDRDAAERIIETADKLLAWMMSSDG